MILRNAIFALLIIMLICPAETFAAKKKKYSKKKDKVKWELKVSSAPTYDNNILSYSDKYKDRFENNIEPERFHINTFDDLFFDNKINASCAFPLYGKYKTEVAAYFSYKKYLKNNIKDWLYANISVEQPLSKRVRIKAGYNLIPNFYVRHYKDNDYVKSSDDDEYKPFEFAKDEFFIRCDYLIFKKTEIRVSYSYMRYFYNEYFTEYDSKDHEIGFRISRELHKKLKLRFAYNYRTSGAKGYDEFFESATNSDDADASFEGETFSLSGSWTLPKIFGKTNKLKFELGYNHDYFRSESTPDYDPLHSGRRDYKAAFSLEYNINLRKNFSIGAIYKLRYRDTGSGSPVNEEYLSDEKDFLQHRAGIELSYIFKL